MSQDYLYSTYIQPNSEASLAILTHLPLNHFVATTSTTYDHEYGVAIVRRKSSHFELCEINKGARSRQKMHYSTKTIERGHETEIVNYNESQVTNNLSGLQGHDQLLGNCNVLAIVNTLEFAIATHKGPITEKIHLKENRKINGQRLRDLTCDLLISRAAQQKSISREEEAALYQLLTLYRENKAVLKEGGASIDQLETTLKGTPATVKSILKSCGPTKTILDYLGCERDAKKISAKLREEDAKLNETKWKDIAPIILHDYRIQICNALFSMPETSHLDFENNAKILIELLEDPLFHAPVLTVIYNFSQDPKTLHSIDTLLGAFPAIFKIGDSNAISLALKIASNLLCKTENRQKMQNHSLFFTEDFIFQFSHHLPALSVSRQQNLLALLANISNSPINAARLKAYPVLLGLVDTFKHHEVDYIKTPALRLIVNLSR